MKPFVIRSATPEDAPACYAIETACFAPSEAATQARIRTRIEIYPEGFLVAEMDDVIIGFTNSGATHKDDISDEALKDMLGHEDNGANLVVFSLAVHPDHQGHGYARRLLDELVSRARLLRKQRVLLLCKSTLVDFYIKLGFEDVGLSASNYAGYAWHQMQKHISPLPTLAGKSVS
jgi:ribosomal protein S18 acetylase RimI-like enzyme